MSKENDTWVLGKRLGEQRFGLCHYRPRFFDEINQPHTIFVTKHHCFTLCNFFSWAQLRTVSK